MGKPIRKTIDLPLYDDEVSIDVTFEILEIVERVYEMRAEYVAARLQPQHPVAILRKDVAAVAVGWLTPRVLSHTRQEIREYVMTANAETLNRYIGAIQAAILYSLKEISDEEFEALSKGQDLDDYKKKPAGDLSTTPTE